MSSLQNATKWFKSIGKPPTVGKIIEDAFQQRKPKEKTKAISEILDNEQMRNQANDIILKAVERQDPVILEATLEGVKLAPSDRNLTIDFHNIRESIVEQQWEEGLTTLLQHDDNRQEIGNIIVNKEWTEGMHIFVQECQESENQKERENTLIYAVQREWEEGVNTVLRLGDYYGAKQNLNTLYEYTIGEQGNTGHDFSCRFDFLRKCIFFNSDLPLRKQKQQIVPDVYQYLVNEHRDNTAHSGFIEAVKSLRGYVRANEETSQTKGISLITLLNDFEKEELPAGRVLEDWGPDAQTDGCAPALKAAFTAVSKGDVPNALIYMGFIHRVREGGVTDCEHALLVHALGEAQPDLLAGEAQRQLNCALT